ncbi:MAG: hypothetical protein AAFX87_01865, partial [Bacteroidota bacterium]
MGISFKIQSAIEAGQTYIDRYVKCVSECSLVSIQVLVKIFFLSILLGLVFNVQAQNKYWVYFNNTCALADELSVNTEVQEDIHMDKHRIDYLKTMGVETINYSAWLDASSVFLNQSQYETLNAENCIEKIEPVRKLKGFSIDKIERLNYNKALKQVNAQALEKAGLTGRGVTVGIIDIGFLYAGEDPYLTHIFDDGRVLGSKDFVNTSGKNIFKYKETAYDEHGSFVWRMISGVDTKKKQQAGIASGSSFYVVRTD